ncbi:MAG: hypothetical protein ACOCRX_03980 [Candidatus Woesearchaeota archaeon]
MVLDKIKFTYLIQPPKKWTFEQPKLKIWTEKNCEGKVLNLFSGKTKLNVNEYRVDINPENSPDVVMDAFDFVNFTNMTFDTIILNPPYNIRKSREKYNGKYIGNLTKIKNKLSRILNENGIIIHYGYDSIGMGAKRGFKKEEICLVCHGGDHNDTICLKERKIVKRLDKY